MDFRVVVRKSCLKSRNYNNNFMINDKIVDRFKVDGDTVWANCLDVVDCIIIDADEKDHRIDADDQKNIIQNFKKIEKDEIILFIRDLTFWNTRCQGCVITDRALHFMLEKDKPEKSFALNWSDISSIQIDNKQFCIVMWDNTKHYIETNLLLKKKDPSEKTLNRIAGFLNEVAQLEPCAQLITNDKLPSIHEDNSSEVIMHTTPPKKQVGEYLSNMGKLVSGVTAFQNRKAAKEKKELADKIMKETSQEIENIRNFANDRLEVLGKTRCEVLQGTVGRFIRIVKSLKNSVKEKEYELSATLSVGEADFKELEGVEMNASNLLATAASGGGLAVVACSGIPAAVTGVVGAVCSASTGTAISSLSGAAATNATLACLGGGSLAAGGGGIAAGATVLAGIKIAATGFGAIIGAAMIAGQIYSKKHTDAENYLAEVQKWQAKSLAASEIMKGVIKRSDELLSITLRLEGRIIPTLDILEDLVLVFNPQNQEHTKIFQRAAILVKSMSELAQTPLLDEAGNLNKQSLIMVDKTQKILNHQLV